MYVSSTALLSHTILGMEYGLKWNGMWTILGMGRDQKIKEWLLSRKTQLLQFTYKRYINH